MDLLRLLRNFADEYLKAMEEFREVEVKSARTSAINHQFINNVRHAVDHMAIAIVHATSENPDLKESERHIMDATFQIGNSLPDAYQHIAGVRMTKLETLLKRAGRFDTRYHAEKCSAEGADQYTLGRNKRTNDPQGAIIHFKEALKLSDEGNKSYHPVTPIQKVNLLRALGLIGTLIAIILLLDKFFRFLPPQ